MRVVCIKKHRGLIIAHSFSNLKNKQIRKKKGRENIPTCANQFNVRGYRWMNGKSSFSSNSMDDFVRHVSSYCSFFLMSF